jgi:hypothetical protein
MADVVLKANIPTHEITLSNGQVVVFNDYITTGQSKELTKTLLGSGRYDSTNNKIQDLPLSSFLESQDKAAGFLINVIKTPDCPDSIFTQDWLDNLPKELGDVIYAEVNRLTGMSQLTDEQKKASLKT